MRHGGKEGKARRERGKRTLRGKKIESRVRRYMVRRVWEGLSGTKREGKRGGQEDMGKEEGNGKKRGENSYI